MTFPTFLNQIRAFNNYVLSAGLALLFGGLFAVLILDTTNWWNIALMSLGVVALAVFLAANLAEVKAVGKKRSTIVRANLGLMAAAMIGILIGLNYVVSRHPVRFDMTSNKIYSLSDQTLDALSKLKQDVDVTMFVSGRGESADIQAAIQKAQQLLEEYEKHSTKFHFKIVDAVRNPAEARQMGIREFDEVVFQSGDNRKDVLRRDYVTFAMGSGGRPVQKFQGESSFTSALMQMSDTSHPVFYFTDGHGEKDLNNPQPDGFAQFKGLLEKQNYETKSVTLLTAGKVPEDAAVLAILGPQHPFEASEAKMIGDYLKNGGKLVLFADPLVKTGLDSLLKDYGIKMGNDIVVDPTSYAFPSPSNVVPQYVGHPIVEKLSSDRLQSVLPYARSVQKTDPALKGVIETVFLQTTDKGWGMTDLKSKTMKQSPGDTKGPVPMAIACELSASDNPSKKTRIVVFGCSSFISNNFLEAPGNGDLGVNTFNWVDEQENKISIRPKEDDLRVVNLTNVSVNLMFFIPVVLIPLATLLVGGFFWYRRRSL